MIWTVLAQVPSVLWTWQLLHGFLPQHLPRRRSLRALIHFPAASQSPQCSTPLLSWYLYSALVFPWCMLHHWSLVHTGMLQTQTGEEQENKAYRCASNTHQEGQAYGHTQHQSTYTKEGQAYGHTHSYSYVPWTRKTLSGNTSMAHPQCNSMMRSTADYNNNTLHFPFTYPFCCPHIYSTFTQCPMDQDFKQLDDFYTAKNHMVTPLQEDHM